MKKAKYSLALVAGLVATIGLSSCNDATYKAGVVLSYTDAAGQVTDYTAEDLFEDYQNSTSAKSTNFDKVYELMIRKYYNEHQSELKNINNKASLSVKDDMKTAANNAENGNSTYSEELEKILSNHGVETIDEDFEYWQYQHEKELFETTFYKDHLEELKTSGFTGGDSTNTLNNGTFLSGTGVEDKGYLVEKMPYHVRHILRKVSAANGELTNGKITATEATNLAKVVTELAAGVDTFGEIANSLSEDSSNTSFGDLGKMDLDESYVNEFKLGVYAYDTLYRQDSPTADGKDKLTPTTAKTVTTAAGEAKTVNEYFAEKGIGTIPYGAAVALAKAAEIDSSNLGYKINEDNENFLPRNILFNKYFNKHNVCVITPNEVPYNSVVDRENQTLIKGSQDQGTYSSVYEALPGFAKYKTQTEATIGFNALCDDTGHVVLVVRAGSSGSYEGVHFIVIERSALDANVNNTTLAEYWTADSESAAIKAGKTTYVNFLKQQTADYKDRAEKVKGWIKGYNSNINSYIFAWLVNNNQITFTDVDFGTDLQNYVQNKIEQSKENTVKSRNETWKTYAEYLIHQDAIRAAGNDDCTGELISETCAIGYLSYAAKDGTGVWAKGGACYGK